MVLARLAVVLKLAFLVTLPIEREVIFVFIYRARCSALGWAFGASFDATCHCVIVYPYLK